MIPFNLSNKIVPKNIGLECLDVPYTPDFGALGKLQEQFGNDIDLMVNKPQYRDLVSANMAPISDAQSFPDLDLSDAQRAELLPSKEYDVNELREYAIGIHNNSQKA